MYVLRLTTIAGPLQSTRDMQLAHAGANIATLQGRLDDEQRRREDAEAMARAASVRGEDLQESVQAAQKALRTIHEMVCQTLARCCAPRLKPSVTVLPFAPVFQVGNTYRDFQKVGYNPLDDSSVHHVPTNAADQLRYVFMAWRCWKPSLTGRLSSPPVTNTFAGA